MDKVVACFGEVLLRLSPPGSELLAQARQFDIHFGGAETNVAVALANLGAGSRVISALPRNALGDLAIRVLRGHNVDTDTIARRDGRLGSYYFTNASGVRQGQVVYDRAGSVFASADSTAFDAPSLLAGADHLHISGISLALGDGPAGATLAMARAAREAGLTVSFDGNFRPGLWALTTRDPVPVITQAIELADVVFGNHKDASLLLGQEFSGDGPERRRDASEALFAAFPNIRMIASTARHVDARNVHQLVGRIDTPETSVQSAERVLSEVVDRIGTGDAFAAGVLHGWLDADASELVVLERGMALSALKHTVAGDFSFATMSDLEAAMAGGGDVRR